LAHDEYVNPTSTEEEMTGQQQRMPRRGRGALGTALKPETSLVRRQGSEQQEPSNTLLGGATGSPP
jgi:hypothetical protein